MKLDEVFNIAENGSVAECLAALQLCKTESKSIRRLTYIQIGRAIALGRRMTKSNKLRDKFYRLSFWKGRSKPNPEKILLHVLMWIYDDCNKQGADRAGRHARAAKAFFVGGQNPEEFADYVAKSGGLDALLKKPDKDDEPNMVCEKGKNCNAADGQDDSCGVSQQNTLSLSVFEQEAADNAILLIDAAPCLIGELKKFDNNKHYWLKVSVYERDDGSFVDLKALKWETEGPTKKLERYTRGKRPTYNNEWLRCTERRLVGNSIKTFVG